MYQKCLVFNTTAIVIVVVVVVIVIHWGLARSGLTEAAWLAPESPSEGLA